MRKVSPLLTLKEKDSLPSASGTRVTFILSLPNALSSSFSSNFLMSSLFWGTALVFGSPKVKVLVWPFRVTVKLLPRRYSATVDELSTTSMLVSSLKLEVPESVVINLSRLPVTPLKWTLLPAPFLSLRVTLPLLSTLTSMRVSALTWSPLLVVIFCSFSFSLRASWNLAGSSLVPSFALSRSSSPKSSVISLLPYFRLRDPLTALTDFASLRSTGWPLPTVPSPEASWVYRAASAS